MTNKLWESPPRLATWPGKRDQGAGQLNLLVVKGRWAGGPTLRLSIMLRETAICSELSGTVVPRSCDTVVPADLAAASSAGGGAALAAAAGAAAGAAGAGAVAGPAQPPSVATQ